MTEPIKCPACGEPISGTSDWIKHRQECPRAQDLPESMRPGVAPTPETPSH